MIAATVVLGTLFSVITSVTAQAELCTTELEYEFFIENILENTPQNSNLGHVNITGNDSEISLSQLPHSYFFFDPSTRNVTLVNTLDTDEGTTLLPNLVLKCSIQGKNDSIFDITVKVILVDYNDNPPRFASEHHTTQVPEDALVGTNIYSQTTATDKDKAFDGNSRVSYRIVQGPEFSNYFRIEVPTKPDITLVRELDYETVTQMEIYIEATDNPSPGRGTQLTSTATLTVEVTDADDQNPEFSEESYRGSISEDAPPGTSVDVTHQIIARDPDTMNVSVIYRILDPYELFAINETTAVVHNVKTLNVKVPMLTVVVLASQVDNPDREWFAMLSISITEANINAPRFDQDVYEVTKTEMEPVGAILVSTTATDIDFGTVIRYSIVEDVDDLSIDEMGHVVLEQKLDYEVEREKTIRVTASDGSHTATATVSIFVLDVNDNNPQLHLDALQFQAPREKGFVITTVSATDADVDNILRIELRHNQRNFAIRSNGEIYITAEPEVLRKDQYTLLIAVIDNGLPKERESSVIIEVNFPALTPGTQSTPVPPTGRPTLTPSGQTTEAIVLASTLPEKDNMLTIILGAVAGMLLIIVIILIVCILWRNKRTKEELDRARAPRGHSAKGLTYRQAETPDDLPKIDLGYTDEPDPVFDIGATTIQQNPLRDSGVNEAYLQSSGSEIDRDISEMDRDVGEIEIETAVVPYDDDFGYPSGRPEYGDRFRTFHGDDTTSNESSHSDSTGGSQRVLVNGNKNGDAKLTTWDSDDKIHPQGAQKLIDSKTVPAAKKKDRPEITVYF